MLLFPSLSNLRFNKFSSDFSVKQGRFTIPEASGEGDSLCIKSSGWFLADGEINQKVECVLSPACFGGLTQLAQAAFEGTSNGGGMFRCKLRGNIVNPKIEIDKSMIQSAVTKMFDNVKNNLMQWLK